MKECSKCNTPKSLEMFHRDKSHKDGRCTMCKECKKEYRTAYRKTDHAKELKRKTEQKRYLRNREKILTRNKAYYEENKDLWARRFKESYYSDKEKYLERSRKDREKYGHRHRAVVAKRRAVKLNATPLWADFEKINKIYEEAVRLTKETGIQYEVDHIIPLQGENISGLHVENNLQIITMRENRIKSNNYEVCDR